MHSFQLLLVFACNLTVDLDKSSGSVIKTAGSGGMEVSRTYTLVQKEENVL